MKRFYEFYMLADEKLRQLAAVLPWMHNVLIMNKVKSLAEAKYYVEQAHEHGLSRKYVAQLYQSRQL
jgi:predicted nuclease of restriction endonuclease-like (RecB) superfamily